MRVRHGVARVAPVCSTITAFCGEDLARVVNVVLDDDHCLSMQW